MVPKGAREHSGAVACTRSTHPEAQGLLQHGMAAAAAAAAVLDTASPHMYSMYV